MTLKSDIDVAVNELTSDWSISNPSRTSTDVPDPDNMGYSDAKKVMATFLYADMVDSSGLIRLAGPEVAASITKAYLKACVRVVRSQDGHIRSFDGDRVMGVFNGPDKVSRAAIAGLKINYAVRDMLDPKVQTAFPALAKAGWKLRHAVGIATTETLMVRAGIRNNSDLVSLGLGPNMATKLSDLRDGSFRTFIGAGTYADLNQNAKIGSDKLDMWKGPFKISFGGGTYSYYKSSYHWSIK